MEVSDMGKRYYVTTPIYYASNRLHVGNAYCTTLADTVARLKRMQGYDVMFLTGTDEHGQKIARNAEAAGKTPKAFVDEIVVDIQKLWERMNIKYDRFIRTTDAMHVQAVQKIFTRLYEQGDIYKSEYEGLYCSPCESFWTESQAVGGNCPDCGRPVELAKEESYFFRLSKYADRLIKHYEDHPDFLQPKSRVAEMMNNFIKPGLEDLCVSRTTLDWGIQVPFDEKHVVYVWVDALTNYINALGYLSDDDSDFQAYWPADVHFVGKEIVRFHAIIWPILLMALDLPLPKKVFGHGWLLLDGGTKLSKSKGSGTNIVDPVILSDRYGVDALRYYLLREIPYGNDGAFSNEGLINRLNSDLANDLGNLVSRTAAMADRYFGGALPEGIEAEPIDEEIAELCKKTAASYEKLTDDFMFPTALQEVWALISRSNKYIDETCPWILAKDEGKRLRLATVLKTLCEAIRVAGILIQPMMPDTSPKIFQQLGLQGKDTAWERVFTFDASGAYTVTTGAVLFPRIDVAEEMAALAEIAAAKNGAAKLDHAEPPEGVATIGIDQFQQVELRVAQVVACEKIPKADKLLKLSLDLGYETRQVVSGIAAWYAPEDLVGKKIIVVANLKPAKLRGVESQGMILAADSGGAVVVVTMPEDTQLGAKVR
ncbi:methionine--tRNA ligase [Oscillospiraceae bacterium OttesenSCG-928-F05]|nr:methionine--tRNA ligase [Oscillospiraceae bacterium OttesenSCG-928-F05]